MKSKIAQLIVCYSIKIWSSCSICLFEEKCMKNSGICSNCAKNTDKEKEYKVNDISSVEINDSLGENNYFLRNCNEFK